MGDCLGDIEIHPVEAQVPIKEGVEILVWLGEEVRGPGQLDKIDVQPHLCACRKLEYGLEEES